jgi:drug/metabolite transporter (DMT)-like permease
MAETISRPVLGSRARGTLFVGLATLAWSSAGAISRLAAVDSWTMLFWRSVFAAAFLLSVLASRPGGVLELLQLTRTGWGVAVSFAVSMVTFLVALGTTTVAHVLIFQAASPFIAAVLAWLLLREHISGSLLLAIAATLAGIGVMVSDTLLEGRWVGDALSMVMMISFALVIVLARLDRKPNMLAACTAAAVMAALAAAPFASWPGGSSNIALLILFGVGQMGLAMLAFTAGVRLLPAADAGLITVLEAVLAPIWAWLAVGEDPGPRAIVGGAIVLAAVVCYSLAQRRAPRGGPVSPVASP